MRWLKFKSRMYRVGYRLHLIAYSRYALVRDCAIVGSSTLFDGRWYLQQNPDVARAGKDPLLHYCQFGWREGRRPGPDFDGRSYLAANPDVKSAGRNPLVHFMLHGKAEKRPLKPIRKPVDRRMDEDVRLVASSSYFDAEWYLRRYKDVAARKVDPAWHYCKFGWKEGREPGPRFNGRSYYMANPDVRKAAHNPLLHYIRHGRKECRRLTPAPQRATSPLGAHAQSAPKTVLAAGNVRFSPEGYRALYADIVGAGVDPLTHYLKHGQQAGRSNGLDVPKNRGEGAICKVLDTRCTFERTKPNCIIVAHESSRTGCPINTWSMLRELQKNYNVLAISLKQGPLDELFAKEATRFVRFHEVVRGNSNYLEFALGRLLDEMKYEFAIVNSVVSHAILPVLAWHRIPSVVCIHEFAQYCSPSDLKGCFLYGTELIYSSNICLDATRRRLCAPKLQARVLAQGISTAPADNQMQPSYREAYMLRMLRTRKEQDNEFVVLASGSVEYRKGVDLFIRVAARIKVLSQNRKVRFLWAGGGADLERDYHSRMYKAQIDTLGISAEFEMLGVVKNMDKFYQLADLFLLTSILDPLPGVVIEAMAHRLPVICFDRASGFPEMFKNTAWGKMCVVEYLDVDAMAKRAIEFISNTDLYASVAAGMYEFSKSQFNMQSYVDKLVCIAGNVRTLFESTVSEIGGYADREGFLIALQAWAARRHGFEDSSLTRVASWRYLNMIPVIYGLPGEITDPASKSTEEIFCAVGENMGNLAFNYALGLLLAEKAEVRPWHSAERPLPSSIGILPCANQLGSHCDMTGARDWEWAQEVEYPMVAVGLGAQSRCKIGGGILDYEIPYLHQGTIDWIRRIANHAPTHQPNIAVRGEFTARVLKSLGLGGRVVALGCPSLFMSDDVNLGTTIATRSRFDRIALASGHEGWKDLDAFENSMSRIITDCDGGFVAQAGLSVVRAARGEYLQLDDKTRERVRVHFRADLTEDQFAKWCERYGHVFYDIPSWMDYYRQFDFVVGPRIHGVMIALQAGVPALCVAIDSRTVELCEMMKVPYVLADEVRKGVSIDDLKRLYKFDPAAFDANRKMLAQRFVDFLRNNKLMPSKLLLDIANSSH